MCGGLGQASVDTFEQSSEESKEPATQVSEGKAFPVQGMANAKSLRHI